MVVALIVPAIAEAQNAATVATEVGTAIVCKLDGDCEIAFEKVSNQVEEPFLFGGRIMDSSHPQYGKYRNAIRKYPDVLTCIDKKKNGNAEPNLLDFDWKNVGRQAETEVCLFRVMTSLQLDSSVQDWLRYYGFQVGELYQMFRPEYTPHFVSQPIAQIQADWTAKQYRQMRPSLFAKILGIDMILSYSVIVQFSQNHKVVGISAIANTK